MRSENTKLTENIKSVANEMSSKTEKTEVMNKKLLDSLTKQFREESESFKKEVSNKRKSEIFNPTETINQLCKDTDLEVISLPENVSMVRDKQDDKMNENMSRVLRQTEKVSQKLDQEIEVLKERLATKRVREDLSGAGSSEHSTTN